MPSARFPGYATPCLAVLLCLPVDARAQEPWPFVSLEVHRYDSLVNMDEDAGLPCCAPHVVAIPGRALIHISAVIDVPWSEELDRVSVFGRDYTLTVPGEEPLSPFGHYDRRGVFEADSTSLSASRPRDWPEADEHLLMEAVWALPEDATTATLTIAEYFSIEIEIPQSVSAPTTPGDTASFTLTGITPLDRLDTVNSVLSQAVVGSITPQAGQIVQVDFDVTPLTDTTLGNRPGFLLWTRDIQLVGPNGLPAIPLGQFLGEGITTNTTNSITGDFIDTAFDKTFFYLTDGSPGDYTLYYLSDPVAEGRLE